MRSQSHLTKKMQSKKEVEALYLFGRAVMLYSNRVHFQKHSQTALFPNMAKQNNLYFLADAWHNKVCAKQGLRFKLAKNLEWTLWSVKSFPWFNFTVNFEWRVWISLGQNSGEKYYEGKLKLRLPFGRAMWRKAYVFPCSISLLNFDLKKFKLSIQSLW